MGPAMGALLTQIVPRQHYASATSLSSLSWHLAAISGPVAGGFLCAWFSFETVYMINGAIILLSFILFFPIRNKGIPENTPRGKLFKELAAGLRFVYSTKEIFGAISLDMIAVLFGGAVAMLPAFADQIIISSFENGTEIGLIRAAPAIGSVIMSVWLAYHPPTKNSGRKLMIAVALFGIFTILIALSKWLWLSFLLMLLAGAADNISVVIRHTTIQLLTPDEMRGRVMAVSGIFIGSSNEIGAFESGLAARLMGLRASVIFGGAMTLASIAFIQKIFPQLEKMELKD